MRYLLAIDATGLHAPEDVNRRLAGRGLRPLLSGLHAHPPIALDRNGALERTGSDNVFESFAEALASARELAPERAADRS